MKRSVFEKVVPVATWTASVTAEKSAALEG